MPGVSSAEARTRFFVYPGEKGDPINVKKIVLCMDFSKHAQGALNHAFSIAKQYNAELTYSHVLGHPWLGGHSKHDS